MELTRNTAEAAAVTTTAHADADTAAAQPAAPLPLPPPPSATTCSAPRSRRKHPHARAVGGMAAATTPSSCLGVRVSCRSLPPSVSLTVNINLVGSIATEIVGTRTFPGEKAKQQDRSFPIAQICCCCPTRVRDGEVEGVRGQGAGGPPARCRKGQEGSGQRRERAPLQPYHGSRQRPGRIDEPPETNALPSLPPSSLSLGEVGRGAQDVVVQRREAEEEGEPIEIGVVAGEEDEDLQESLEEGSEDPDRPPGGKEKERGRELQDEGCRHRELQELAWDDPFPKLNEEEAPLLPPCKLIPIPLPRPPSPSLSLPFLCPPPRPSLGSVALPECSRIERHAAPGS